MVLLASKSHLQGRLKDQQKDGPNSNVIKIGIKNGSNFIGATVKKTPFSLGSLVIPPSVGIPF